MQTNTTDGFYLIINMICLRTKGTHVRTLNKYRFISESTGIDDETIGQWRDPNQRSSWRNVEYLAKSYQLLVIIDISLFKYFLHY